MLLLFSARVAEGPLILERAIHSVYCGRFVGVCRFVCVLSL